MSTPTNEDLSQWLKAGSASIEPRELKAELLEQPKIWYKNQRVWRTVLQAILALPPVVVAFLGIVYAQWPTPWLAAALALSVAVQGVVSKIMANETINAWLIQWTPFGSEPRHRA